RGVRLPVGGEAGDGEVVAVAARRAGVGEPGEEDLVVRLDGDGVRLLDPAERTGPERERRLPVAVPLRRRLGRVERGVQYPVAGEAGDGGGSQAAVVITTHDDISVSLVRNSGGPIVEAQCTREP